MRSTSSRSASGVMKKVDYYYGGSSTGGGMTATRSGTTVMVMLVMVAMSTWQVYQVQWASLPSPLDGEQAGESALFSEMRAMKHVENVTAVGPRPVSSDALESAVKYVLGVAKEIAGTSPPELDIEAELFHPKAGANRVDSGLFVGKTLLYSDLKHVLLRIAPKSKNPVTGDGDGRGQSEVILVSSHIDTVFSCEGAGDDATNVGVMLELARGLKNSAKSTSGFKKIIVFLFNTGEEDGLNGAHSFITQHPWKDSINIAIDLEGQGLGGKSALFQGSSSPKIIDMFAKASKRPTAQIIMEEVFSSGVINSGTDFQVYREVGGLQGLDFAYTDKSAVYHTKNDKTALLRPGSLQHLGDNLLPFLGNYLNSDEPLLAPKHGKGESSDQDDVIYFDVLGMYMVVYKKSFGTLLNYTVALLSLLALAASLLRDGIHGVVSFGLSCVATVSMWICSLGMSALVAIALPLVSPFTIPYIANTWLLTGLFGVPAFIGAFVGQHVGFLLLNGYLSQIDHNTGASIEAERWLFKGSIVQWMLLLIAGNYFKVGSSYLALIWLVSLALAYGLLEVNLSSEQQSKPLNPITLGLGMIVPLLVSGGIFIQLVGSIVGNFARLEKNPGSSPEWIGNVVIAVLIAVVVCLALGCLISYIHTSDGKRMLVVVMAIFFALTLVAVSSGVVPAFTEDVARSINIVHVVDATGGGRREPSSYVTLFSTTPGHLRNEAESLKDEGFECGTGRTIDFVSFKVKYSCDSVKEVGDGWNEFEVPELKLGIDWRTNATVVSVDTKFSIRWAMAVNRDQIADFSVHDGSKELVPMGDKTAVNGWHIVQFAGGKQSPTAFKLKLVFNSHLQAGRAAGDDPLLKLRTDFTRTTPKVSSVLGKLPKWCSLYGKSNFPFTLSYLTALPANFGPHASS